MKDIFTKWYSAHDISGNEARLRNRLEMLEAMAEDGESPHLFDLFNFVLGINTDSQSVSDYFSKKIKEYEGEDFLVSKNELNILSYGIILYLSQNGEGLDKLKTNLVLKILSFQKELPSKLFELTAMSSEYLIQESMSDRKKRYGGAALKKEIDALGKTLEPTVNNITSQGAPILKAIRALSTAIEQLSSDLGAVREENQLLWWEKSMHLNSLDKSITDLSEANRIICCAHDLYQESLYHSTPVSAPQFIVGAFNYANSREQKKSLALKSLVEGLEIEIAAKILEDFESETSEYRLFFPILNALKIGYDNSIEKNKSSTKLPPKANISKLNLTAEEAAELALCEVTLARLENE